MSMDIPAIDALENATQLDYGCRLCGRLGAAFYEREFVRQAEAWLNFLHCDRCADFRNQLSKFKQRIKRTSLHFWQEMMKPPTQRDSGALKTIEEKLVDLTKRVSTITCRHWRVQNLWEYDFVQQIKDHPGKTEAIVNGYCAGIKIIGQRENPL